jgi:nitrogen fixation/metabolism regulation signal transduction histidine kinase
MAFTDFRLNVGARVLLIALLSFVSLWGWVAAGWLVTPVVSGVLAAGAVVELIHYVERGARELTSFLTFIAHHDFSVPPAVPFKGRVFADLDGAYGLLARQFRRLNLDKAAKQQYLEAVVEHVGVALVCFDDNGQVSMLNEPARKLFALPHLQSMKSFERIDERLPLLLWQLGAGDRSLLSVRRDDETLQLVLFATRFELVGRAYKLVSFQNIRDELERHEIDSWQKLIRVLTHEIMNSVTPIISLSGLVRETLVDEAAPAQFRALTVKDQEDMLRSLTAIHTRSTGLLDFVQAYRSFANLPAPTFVDVDVCALLERVRTLMAGEIAARGIDLMLDCADSQLRIRADPHQIEQVLINLLRNAVEALAEQPSPHIELRGQRDHEGRVVLQVTDNGPGVDAEHRDNIFVPFFTTKRNGTGVGLSISRQLTHANRGLISQRTAPGGGSIFSLRFRV